jgi:vacuolar-type H+-ATPase subunit I/STV1
MGVQVDNYCTTSFVLKDEKAVEYIKKLCELLSDESNLYTGYLSSDAWCDMHSYGKEPHSFYIKTGGYMDSGPELRASAIDRLYGEATEEEEIDEEQEELAREEDNDRDPISLWDEIQKNLKEGTWFFVDGYSWDRSNVYTSVQFFHQDGRNEYVASYDIKKKILKDMKI